MRLRHLLSGLLALQASPNAASTLDNEAGEYTLSALPDPLREAERMDRMQLSDQQPAGRQVRKGETLIVHTSGLPPGFVLSATVGFLPMWNVEQTEQVEVLDEGETRFRADQDGPLFFRLNPPAGRDGARAEVRVRLNGGRPLPLYVDGAMDAQDWSDELEAHGHAAFVQLLGERALITLPATVYARQPIPDPSASFATIDRVIQLQDELAGFDASSGRDAPTRLRLHYLVDFRVSAADRETFYMYATDQFIGMLDDNTADLTDPRRLRQQWGIWHETGHTYQQNSWTFDALGEVNVNLFSLYVQERFGQPSALHQAEEGEAAILERARDYLAQGASDYLEEPPEDEDSSGYFIRLVLFHQLKEVYGWELFMDLHKHFRAHPLPADASDQDRADAFVQALCLLTGHDLRPFFERWGLRVSEAADAAIAAQNYAVPQYDIAGVF